MSTRPSGPPINPFPPQNPPVEAIRAVARVYGGSLNIPSPLDGRKMMLALADVESSMGRNLRPRYEHAYDGPTLENPSGGTVWRANPLQQRLVGLYGTAAAASYGPWQMMFINFKQPVDPHTLTDDIQLCAREFVRHFNNYVIDTRHAKTLSEIGQVWNGGHIFTGSMLPAVTSYVAKLEKAYEEVV